MRRTSVRSSENGWGELSGTSIASMPASIHRRSDCHRFVGLTPRRMPTRPRFSSGIQARSPVMELGSLASLHYRKRGRGSSPSRTARLGVDEFDAKARPTPSAAAVKRAERPEAISMTGFARPAKPRPRRTRSRRRSAGPKGRRCIVGPRS